MYLNHYCFSKSPFALTPNTEFFVNLRDHEACFNLLMFALTSGEGFVKIVGEVGTGKTLICRKLLNSLDSQGFITAYIGSPNLSPTELNHTLAHELGLKLPENLANHLLIKKLYHYLIHQVKLGKRVVLLIDEAQVLAEATLESLRLLTNLETEKEKLVQVVLFGQPELEETLNRKSLRQFKQRIAFSYRLRPLPYQSTRHYIEHRLAIAGFNGENLFSKAAIRKVYKGTGGIPRLINIICHKALLCAFARGAGRVTQQHVALALRDTDATQKQASGLLPVGILASLSLLTSLCLAFVYLS